MEIRKATKEDLPEVFRMSEEQLGKNYIALPFLTDAISDFDTNFKVILEDGRIRGFFIAVQNLPSGLLENMKNLNSFNENSSMSLLKTIVVSPDSVGRGLGKAMVEDWMKMAGSDKDLYSLNWQSEGEIPLNHLLEKLEFQRLMEINEFWKEESLTKKSICPTCSEPPCRCSAVVYFRAGIS